jgi:ABC-type transport system involved in Fe-S cluster assembly fused permease/ATPase subunit
MEWKSSASLTLLNLFQSLVINTGLFAISLYCFITIIILVINTFYLVMEWKSSASLTLLNLFQSLVINTGLFAISLYCAHLVAVDRQVLGIQIMTFSFIYNFFLLCLLWVLLYR